MTYHDEAIAKSIAEKVERFVRDEILPYEKDRRLGNHGPSEELVREIRDKAVKARIGCAKEDVFGTHSLGHRKVGVFYDRACLRRRRRACLFLISLPNPAVKIERVLDTIDSSMPGGHSVVNIENLRCSADEMLGAPGEGFKLAQIRLAPARLSHCMRWLGLGYRAQEIASEYACKREAFRKLLIDHEGVGFKLAENQIDLQQSRLMTFWCAAALDRGERANIESSMAKVAVSEALFNVADKCVQILGGTGVSQDTIVEQFFREIRAFRIYDGPTEVHKWSLAKKIKHATLV